MAKVIIHPLDPEMNTLHRLAQQQFRPIKSQTVLLIRNEPGQAETVAKRPVGNATVLLVNSVQRIFNPATPRESDF